MGNKEINEIVEAMKVVYYRIAPGASINIGVARAFGYKEALALVTPGELIPGDLESIADGVEALMSENQNGFADRAQKRADKGLPIEPATERLAAVGTIVGALCKCFDIHTDIKALWRLHKRCEEYTEALSDCYGEAAIEAIKSKAVSGFLDSIGADGALPETIEIRRLTAPKTLAGASTGKPAICAELEAKSLFVSAIEDGRITRLQGPTSWYKWNGKRLVALTELLYNCFKGTSYDPSVNGWSHFGNLFTYDSKRTEQTDQIATSSFLSDKWKHSSYKKRLGFQ